MNGSSNQSTERQLATENLHVYFHVTTTNIGPVSSRLEDDVNTPHGVPMASVTPGAALYVCFGSVSQPPIHSN